MQNDTHIKIEQLSFYRSRRTVFDNISLEIPRGKITAIMGPSGTGKTTLLKLIGGQLRPQQGQVYVNDTNIQQLSRQKLHAVRKRMGMLFQNGALFTHLSVFDNVAFPLRQHTELSEALIRHIVLMKLEAVGLRGALYLQPSQLSGGMARRVALARAIALDPELIMYDEPFAGQDPISMGVIVGLIQKLNKSLGLTTIIVSHDVAETSAVSDLIYVMAGGNIVARGEPTAVMADRSPQVHQFMRGLPDGVVPFHYPAIDFYEDFVGCKQEVVS